MSLLGCILHHEDGNLRKMPSICKQPQSLFRDPHLCLFLFLNRAQSADEGGAESWGSDPPRGEKFLSDMQLFYFHDQCAVVPTKS